MPLFRATVMAWNLFFSILALPIVLALGIPTFYVLRVFNHLRWMPVAAVSVAESLLAATLVQLLLFNPPHDFSIRGALWDASAGLIVGLTAFAVLSRFGTPRE